MHPAAQKALLARLAEHVFEHAALLRRARRERAVARADVCHHAAEIEVGRRTDFAEELDRARGEDTEAAEARVDLEVDFRA